MVVDPYSLKLCGGGASPAQPLAPVSLEAGIHIPKHPLALFAVFQCRHHFWQKQTSFTEWPAVTMGTNGASGISARFHGFSAHNAHTMRKTFRSQLGIAAMVTMHLPCRLAAQQRIPRSFPHQELLCTFAQRPPSYANRSLRFRLCPWVLLVVQRCPRFINYISPLRDSNAGT